MIASEVESPTLARGRRLERRTIAVGATALVAIALAVRFAAAVLVNAPAPPAALPQGPIERATAGLAALVALGLGATADDPVTGVGLLFVGVFGLLAVGVGLATPAAVALVAGTAVVAVGSRAELDAVTGAATALLVVALAVSLAGGVVRPTLRPTGSTLALLAVAATPAFAATDWRAFLGGGVAFVLVTAVALANPFVAGATTLVGSGVVGTSMPVVALAVGGAVTTASAALRQRRFGLLTGVVILALAGVPATLSRAIPFALGVATLLTLEVRR